MICTLESRGFDLILIDVGMITPSCGEITPNTSSGKDRGIRLNVTRLVRAGRPMPEICAHSKCGEPGFYGRLAPSFCKQRLQRMGVEFVFLSCSYIENAI